MDETLRGLIRRLEGVFLTVSRRVRMELEKIDGCFFSKFGSCPFLKESSKNCG